MHELRVGKAAASFGSLQKQSKTNTGKNWSNYLHYTIWKYYGFYQLKNFNKYDTLMHESLTECQKTTKAVLIKKYTLIL